MKILTYKNVLQRISDLTDLVDISTHQPRLKRLIYKAAIDSKAASALITKTGVPLQVINGLAEKPCDLIRLLRVHSSFSPTDTGARLGEPMEPTRLHKKGYDHDATYIKPISTRNGFITIDYYAIPFIDITDEDGNVCQELSISHEQLDYCAYEAISIILRDEWARNKINANVYLVFEEKATDCFYVAKGSMRNFTIDQMESTTWMLRNAQFFNTK